MLVAVVQKTNTDMYNTNKQRNIGDGMKTLIPHDHTL